MDRIVNKGDIRVRVDVRGGANDLLAPGESDTYGIVDNVNELSETCAIYRDGQQILGSNLDVDGEDESSDEQEAEEHVEAEDSEQESEDQDEVEDEEQVEEQSDENDESDDEQEAEQDEEQSEDESEDSEQSLDELDYRELQELAGEYEDVQGNLPKDELLEELKAQQ